MKLETVSLELAQRLFECGYPQDESIGFWVKDYYDKDWMVMIRGFQVGHKGGIEYAAPTLVELLPLLPSEILMPEGRTWKGETLFHFNIQRDIWFGKSSWYITYTHNPYNVLSKYFMKTYGEDNLTEPAGLMLAQLAEEGWVKFGGEKLKLKIVAEQAKVKMLHNKIIPLTKMVEEIEDKISQLKEAREVWESANEKEEKK